MSRNSCVWFYGNWSERLNISPILYGSLACAYHTKETELPVHDLDFLIPEGFFPEIMQLLDQAHIQFELKPWASLVITRGDLKVELDSVERYLGGRSSVTEQTEIHWVKLNILNLLSLASIYEEAISNIAGKEEHQERLELYTRKYNLLKAATAI